MQITVATYNIRHARGNDGRVSLTRVADTMQTLQADVIALQEVDRYVPRSRFANQAKVLARYTGMNFSFAPNLRFFFISSFGNAILCRYPILKQNNFLLPGKKEQRGLQHCIIALPLTGRISLFNTHLGLSSDDRSQQIEAITKEIQTFSSYPILLAGDFNCCPGATELKPLAAILNYGSSSPINTFPSGNPTEPVDHIYVSPQWTLSDMRVHPSDASDHLPLVCKLRLK